MSREDEARRDLQRFEREREKLLSATPPADGGDDGYDAIEKLGRRIARILGPIIAAALAIYLFVAYLA